MPSINVSSKHVSANSYALTKIAKGLKAQKRSDLKRTYDALVGDVPKAAQRCDDATAIPQRAQTFTQSGLMFSPAPAWLSSYVTTILLPYASPIDGFDPRNGVKGGMDGGRFLPQASLEWRGTERPRE